MTNCSRDHIFNGLLVKEFLTPNESRTGPILVIHGGCHGWWAFEEWLPLFAAWGRPSYALSLRNHTDSYSTSDREFLKLTLADYESDVLEVLKWLGKRPILIGHSMGGIIGQKVAEKEKVAAVGRSSGRLAQANRGVCVTLCQRIEQFFTTPRQCGGNGFIRSMMKDSKQYTLA